MRPWRGLAFLILVALPAAAQIVSPVPTTPVAPIPVGPHGAYFTQLGAQVQTLLSVPAPLPQAFRATVAKTPEIRTPAAFAARAAIAQALASPTGLRELERAIAAEEGPKAKEAAKSLRTLARAIGEASAGERTALGAQARSLNTRFDGATALPGESVDLASIPTDHEDGPGRKASRESMTADRAEMTKLAEKLSAGKVRGVLVVLQGMDAGGKGGASKRPLKLPTSWARLSYFKKPTPEEAAQHFLTRIEAALPQGKIEGARGWLQIFDRSHYEDLVMPTILGTHSKEEIEARYAEILAFERKLAEAGIVVVKLFMHESYDTQEERLDERLVKRSKQYKASQADWDMHKRFPDFMKVWGEVIARTSTPYSIWNIIPADNKPRRDAAIARVVLKTLERMGLDWPENPELASIRR